MQYYLAIDIGASSGRHILGHVENGKIILEEMHRFDNNRIQKNNHDCWDIDVLFANVKAGIEACVQAGKRPTTLGIDTWGVDFALIDSQGTQIGDTVSYRDTRADHQIEKANTLIPFAEHYSHTGIQYQAFNTVYQLMALKEEHPEQLEQAQHMLLTPEYLNYLLTGVIRNEYTISSSSALVNAVDKTWDDELIEIFGLPRRIFGPLYTPGTSVGMYEGIEVVLVPCHDTASAFLAVPAQGPGSVYLSSGTWSLLGVEMLSPITSQAGMNANFSNEGGYLYRYRFLKNIEGLWRIQNLRKETGLSFADLESAARLGSPGAGEKARTIYLELASSYAEAITELSTVTGETYDRIHIVGGGSRDSYLNELTAQATRLSVIAGPVEGTALGNLMSQMIRAGEFSDLHEARAAVPKSFELKKVLYESV
jgi:rhamnulokinase